MIEKPTFLDPYKDSPKRVRLQSYINRTDYNIVRSIHPDKGTIQIVVNTFWSKLITTLKKHGINDISSEQQFEQFINDFALTIPSKVSGGTEPRGRATSRATRKTNGKL
jgi:hypothetical protein